MSSSSVSVLSPSLSNSRISAAMVGEADEVGMEVGRAEGEDVGVCVGLFEGLDVCRLVGLVVGRLLVGHLVGLAVVGDADGFCVGLCEGPIVGSFVGLAVEGTILAAPGRIWGQRST